MKKYLILLLVIIASAACLCGCNKGDKPNDTEPLSYRIVAKLDVAAETLECRQTVDYINTSNDSINVLKFNLYPSAYRENAKYQAVLDKHKASAYYSGESYGGISISEVSLNGNPITFSIDGEDENILTVNLPSALSARERASINMSYIVTLPKNNSRFGVTQSGVSLCNFYPQLCVYNEGWYEAPYYAIGDPFYSCTANYAVDIITPEGGVTAASGTLAEKFTSDNLTTYRYSAENVRDFAAVYLPEGRVISNRLGGVDINYYYTSDATPHNSLAMATRSIECFERCFGAYPYNTFSVVDTHFIYGGMEYPNLVIINNILKGFSREYTIAHETAHQWWYGVVGSNQIEQPWQDEGLTEFSTALYFKLTGRESVFKHVISATAEAYANAVENFNETKIPFNGKMDIPLADYHSETAYTVTAYNRGMLMHYSIYTLLGEKEYLASLQNYYNNNKYGIATPSALISSFPESCAKIFKNWLSGTVKIGNAA